MVTKGIIKSIDLLGNTCTVHIPFFETAGNDPIIETATVSNTPGSYNGYKVGDVVYVAFEDGSMSNPVIIGKLYLGTEKEKADPRGVSNVEESSTAKKATLPADSKLTAELDSSVPNTTVPYSSLSSIANGLNTLNTEVGQMDRDYGNRFKQVSSAITESGTELTSKLEQSASEIRAEVSEVTKGLSGEIEKNSTSIKETAKAIELEAQTREEAIDGVTKAYEAAIKVESDRITAEVAAREEAINGVTAEYTSAIEQTAKSINARVDSKVDSRNDGWEYDENGDPITTDKDGNEIIRRGFGWDLGNNAWAIKAYDQTKDGDLPSEGLDIFKVTRDSVIINAPNVTLAGYPRETTIRYAYSDSPTEYPSLYHLSTDCAKYVAATQDDPETTETDESRPGYHKATTVADCINPVWTTESLERQDDKYIWQWTQTVKYIYSESNDTWADEIEDRVVCVTGFQGPAGADGKDGLVGKDGTSPIKLDIENDYDSIPCTFEGKVPDYSYEAQTTHTLRLFEGTTPVKFKVLNALFDASSENTDYVIVYNVEDGITTTDQSLPNRTEASSDAYSAYITGLADDPDNEVHKYEKVKITYTVYKGVDTTALATAEFIVEKRYSAAPTVKVDIINDFVSVPCSSNKEVTWTAEMLKSETTHTVKVYEGLTEKDFSVVNEVPTTEDTEYRVQQVSKEVSSVNSTASSGSSYENKISALNADVGTITYNLYKGTTLIHSTKFEATKIVAGKDGESYKLIASASQIKQDKSGNKTPSSITFNARKQIGNQNASAFTEAYFKVYINGVENTTLRGQKETGTYTFNNIGDVTSDLKVEIYYDSNYEILLDRETIPVVADGEDLVDYYVLVEPYQVVKNPNTNPVTYTPNKVKFTFWKQIGSETPTELKDSTFAYSLSGGVTKGKTTIGTAGYIEESITSNTTISLYTNRSNNAVLLDTETVSVVSDGGDGVGIVSQTTYYALIHPDYKAGNITKPSDGTLTVIGKKAGESSATALTANSTVIGATENEVITNKWSLIPPAHTNLTLLSDPDKQWRYWTTVRTERTAAVATQSKVSYSTPIINEEVSGAYRIAQGKTTNYYSADDPAGTEGTSTYGQSIKKGDCWFKTGTSELFQWGENIKDDPTSGYGWQDIGGELVANKVTATYINALDITANRIDVPGLFTADSTAANVQIAGFDVEANTLTTGEKENGNLIKINSDNTNNCKILELTAAEKNKSNWATGVNITSFKKNDALTDLLVQDSTVPDLLTYYATNSANGNNYAYVASKVVFTQDIKNLTLYLQAPLTAGGDVIIASTLFAKTYTGDIPTALGQTNIAGYAEGNSAGTNILKSITYSNITEGQFIYIVYRHFSSDHNTTNRAYFYLPASIRFSVGENFQVLADGTVYAKNLFLNTTTSASTFGDASNNESGSAGQLSAVTITSGGIGNKESLDDDKLPGVYIGPDGISIGTGFKVTAGGLPKIEGIELTEAQKADLVATTYWISSSCTIHTGNKHGKDISITAMKKTGSDPETPDREAYLWWKYAGDTDWVRAGPGQEIPDYTFTISAEDIKNEDILILAAHEVNFNPKAHGILDERIYEREEITFSPLNTPILDLTNDSGALAYDGNSKITASDTVGTTATLYLNGVKLPDDEVTYNWELNNCHQTDAKTDTTAEGASINIKYLDATIATATCTATYKGVAYQKVFTITKQLKGAQGSSGSSPITLEIENDYDSIPCDYTGTIIEGYDWAEQTTHKLRLFKGTTSVSFKVSATRPTTYNTDYVVVYSVESGISATLPTRASASEDAYAASITGLSVDKAKINYTVYFGTSPTILATGCFTAEKRKAGNPGDPAVDYYILADKYQIRYDPNTKSYPEGKEVQLSFWKQVGNNEPSCIKGDEIQNFQYSIDNGQNMRTPQIDTDGLMSLEVTESVTVALYTSTGTLLDTETISVIHDGTKGADGVGTQGRSVLSTIKYYTLATSIPSTPSNDTENPDGWSDSPPAFNKATHSGYNYYETTRTKYNSTDSNGHLYSWSTPVQNSLLSVDFIESLGITTKKISVPDSEGEPILEADGYVEEPYVRIGGFEVTKDRLHSLKTTGDGTIGIDISTKGIEDTICTVLRSNWGLIIGEHFGVDVGGRLVARHLLADNATIRSGTIANFSINNDSLTGGGLSLSPDTGFSLTTDDGSSTLNFVVDSTGPEIRYSNKGSIGNYQPTYDSNGALMGGQFTSGFLFSGENTSVTEQYRAVLSYSESSDQVCVKATVQKQVNNSWVDVHTQGGLPYSSKTIYVKVTGRNKYVFGGTDIEDIVPIYLEQKNTSTSVFSNYTDPDLDFDEVYSVYFCKNQNGNPIEGNTSIYQLSGYTITSSNLVKSYGSIVPLRSGTGYNLGSSTNWWNEGRFNTLYNNSGSSVVSDRKEKNTIDYDISKYDLIFDTLKPVSYKYNNGESGRTHLGFIAQDIQESIEQANLTTKDYSIVVIEGEGFDKDLGRVINEENAHYYIRLDQLHALEVRQIQLLKAQVKQQAEEIAELKQMVKDLTTK